MISKYKSIEGLACVFLRRYFLRRLHFSINNVLGTLNKVWLAGTDAMPVMLLVYYSYICAMKLLKSRSLSRGLASS